MKLSKPYHKVVNKRGVWCGVEIHGHIRNKLLQYNHEEESESTNQRLRFVNEYQGYE